MERETSLLHDGAERPGPALVPAPVRGPRRRWGWVLGGGLLAAALTAGGYLLVPRAGDDGPTAAPSPSVATVTVQRTDLADTRTLPGNLGFAAPTPVRGTGPRRVTWLPDAGVLVDRGQPLWRADDRPVVLLLGDTPLFRPLDAVGLVGRDVRVLRDNLEALGYRVGAQPREGTLVPQPVPPAAQVPAPAEVAPAPEEVAPAPAPGKEAAGKEAAGEEAAGERAAGRKADDATAPAGPAPSPPAPAVPAPPAPPPERVEAGDAVYTTALRAAVRRWQRDLGLPATGSVDPGDAVVLPAPVRVAGPVAALGAPVEADVLAVTPPEKAVHLSVPPEDAGSLAPGQPVTVSLPGGGSAEADVSGVGEVVQQPEAGEGQAAVSVTLRLRDPAAGDRWQAAPVQVVVPVAVREDVLAVPVGALLALAEGGYAVQRPDGSLLAVTTGLFAGGLVEVTGQGLAEGTTVVTAT